MNQGVVLAITVLTNTAKPALAFTHDTPSWAEITPDAPARQLLVEESFLRLHKAALIFLRLSKLDQPGEGKAAGRNKAAAFKETAAVDHALEKEIHGYFIIRLA
jgi:hypothetical protein